MRYTINGIEYIQQPLVLGQISQLIPALQGVVFTSFEPVAVIGALADKLPEALAIVLRREGEALAGKKLAEYLDNIVEADFDTTVRIVTDFFSCNPIASLLEQVAGLIAHIEKSLGTTISESSVASSPEGT
jgi:hypothetical protein